MGTLFYGDAATPIRIEDRALAHLKVAIITKLRRGESFTLSWQHPDDQPRGRSTLWLHPNIPLRFVFDDICAAGAICADSETCQEGRCYERCVIPTPIGALGDRRSPSLTCPESPTCVDGEPPTCVPHGTGFGVHTCEQTVPGEPLVHVIRHCDGACDTSRGVADCVP